MEEKRIFRKTDKEDLNAIMKIIDAAKMYLKTQKIPQWQDGYPNRESFLSDMEKGNSYILEENGKVVATIAVCFDGDAAYDTIYDGSWLTNGQPYVAIHRVAVDASKKGKGLAGIMIEEVVKMCKERGIASIKNDTHRLNHSMQGMLIKNGFVRCGMIYLNHGEERIGYERVIDHNCNKL